MMSTLLYLEVFSAWLKIVCVCVCVCVSGEGGGVTVREEERGERERERERESRYVEGNRGVSTSDKNDLIMLTCKGPLHTDHLSTSNHNAKSSQSPTGLPPKQMSTNSHTLTYNGL